MVVTLLVALGIAVVQGCQGPARGLGDDHGRQGSAQAYGRVDTGWLVGGRGPVGR
ncbi:hypothetical protein [Streptomyces antibioticus]|uniref:hypothetical protein n=1 Tax=Streptomyces antibioticus TaxID=1890 RepID=UPI003D6B98C6